MLGCHSICGSDSSSNYFLLPFLMILSSSVGIFRDVAALFDTGMSVM
jgi:hypothetical protein